MRKLLLLVSSFLLTLVAFGQRQQAFKYCAEGEKALQEKKYEKALRNFDQCLSLDPARYEAYSMRALVKSNLNKTEAAITDYNIYLEFHPEQTDALFSRGSLHYLIEHYEMAKADFQKLLELPFDGSNTLFYRINSQTDGIDKMFTQSESSKDPIYNFLGLTEFQLILYDESLAHFDQAISINPKEPDYYLNRGICYEAKGNETKALSDYKSALVLDADHAGARQHLGKLLAENGETPESIDYLSEAIKENPMLPYPYIERAYHNLKSKKYQLAIDDYNVAIKLDSMNEELWLNRAIAKEQLGKFQGAYIDYTQAIHLKPDYSKAWLNRANLLVKMNRLEDSINDYNVAVLHEPRYELAYYNRALAKHRLKLNDEACNDLKTAENLGMEIDTKIKSSICSHKNP